MALTMSFDVQLATQIGLHNALLLQAIGYWVLRNRANEKHIYEGKAWSYNSMAAFAQQFPFMTRRAIEYTLSKLKADGLIETGNFNKMAFDRTKWYTLTEKGERLLQGNSALESKSSPSETENPSPENVNSNPQNGGVPFHKIVDSHVTKLGNEISQNCDTNTIYNPIYTQNIKEKNKREKPKKNSYGEYGNVLLTDEELSKLKSEFPTDWQGWIDRVDGYCAQNGKRYTNYLATIRNWARREKENGATARTSQFSNRQKDSRTQRQYESEKSREQLLAMWEEGG